MHSGFTDQQARRFRRARRRGMRALWYRLSYLVGAARDALTVRLARQRRGWSDPGPGAEGAGRPAPLPPGPPHLSAAAAVALPSAPDPPADARYDRRRPGSR